MKTFVNESFKNKQINNFCIDIRTYGAIIMAQGKQIKLTQGDM